MDCIVSEDQKEVTQEEVLLYLDSNRQWSIPELVINSETEERIRQIIREEISAAKG